MKRDQQLSCPKKGNQSAYVVGVAQSLPWGVPQKLSTQLCPLWFDVLIDSLIDSLIDVWQ
jgi:hypothetical protein